MRFMISQPISGLPEEQIENTIERATDHLNLLGHTVINSYIKYRPREAIQNVGVYYLGRSLMVMAECDGVFFCKGWEGARGCRIEHEVAKSYGLQIMYE